MRLPVAVMNAASLSVDDTVDIQAEGGRIIITLAQPKKYSLDALLSGISDENIHRKIDFGPAQGKELL